MRLVGRAVARALVATGLLAGGYAVVAAHGVDGSAAISREPDAPAPVTASPAQRVGRLVEQHDCWTGTAPAGVVPGHVVVTVDGRVRYSARLVDDALEAVFGTPHVDLVVHAFCP